MKPTKKTLAAALLVAFLLQPLAVTAGTLPPTSWPNSSVTRPSIDGWSHALRVFGDDRYQTGLSASLVLRGSTDATSYPFGSPDPAASSGWWGLATCPRSIIVAAGDNPADALVASSLSDPTGRSSEPFLQRSAAADPLFDPIGGFQRVDTDFAPILVTRSSRQGATSLDLSTRLAAQDLRNGGCTTARQAIIVGGTSSIPSSVDTELVAIGYEQVFRVAGSSRYDTAKLVAESLGTAEAPGSPTPTSCEDPNTADGSAYMAFYANSVIEYRESSSDCRLLNRTVVVADGISGIDALAAGWWTSYWQVPIVLHNGTDVLPVATSQALQTLRAENVIVLGGPSRISEAVVGQIAAASNRATVVRVAGSDRYETSVAMAQRFGGWWPSGRGRDFEGSMVCVAASSGGSATSAGLGWADALSAGPWCARANGAFATSRMPVRALAPAVGQAPAVSASGQRSGRPGRDATPVLLVPVGGSALPASVQSLLSAAFKPADAWCSSVVATPSCLLPGFAIVFGGASNVTDQQVGSLSRLVSGGLLPGQSDRSPRVDSVFQTGLDMGPVFDDLGSVTPGSGQERVCVPRGGLVGARWLTVTGATSSATLDVMTRGRFVSDADGVSRSPGVSAPHCLVVPFARASSMIVNAASLAGPRSDSTVLDARVPNRVSLSAPLTAASPTTFDGVASESDLSAGGSTSWAFTSVGGGSVSSRASTARLERWTASITLTRGSDIAARSGPDTFRGTFTIVTDRGTLEGTVSGEALFQAGAWRLRGTTSFLPGTWNTSSGGGGFVADITVADPGLNDDSIAWRADGLVS